MKTAEEIYDMINSRSGKAWNKKEIATMVAKVYAQQCCEDLRERMVKEVRTKEGVRFTCSNDRLVRYKEMVVDKDSIRNVEIITP